MEERLHKFYNFLTIHLSASHHKKYPFQHVPPRGTQLLSYRLPAGSGRPGPQLHSRQDGPQPPPASGEGLHAAAMS